MRKGKMLFTMGNKFRKAWCYVACSAVLAGVMCGCAPRKTHVEFETLGKNADAERFVGDFNMAFYRRLPGGKWAIVLRSERPSSVDPTQTITQLLYVRTFWKPIPGATDIEPSQINSKLYYAVLTPPTGVRFDGAAFVTAKVDPMTGELAGRIESGTLVPRYRMGDAVEPFESARLDGTFRAKEDPRAVIDVLQTIETNFGDSKAVRTPFPGRGR